MEVTAPAGYVAAFLSFQLRRRFWRLSPRSANLWHNSPGDPDQAFIGLGIGIVLALIPAVVWTASNGVTGPLPTLNRISDCAEQRPSSRFWS